MLFNSPEYILFLPIVLLVNYLLPAKIRYIWLLIASYFFYMCWNAEYALLILTSTAVTYGCSLLVEKNRDGKHRKAYMALSLVLNLGILFFFKYSNFLAQLINDVSAALHIKLSVPKVDVLLPVGISFYTFQALGYTIDVYRGKVQAERNFLRYALFVSFFPQLVAGPIERSENLLTQLREPKKFTWDNFKTGLLYMLWGFFMKIVLADRIAIFVDTVYGDIPGHPGLYLVIATMLFAVQILCDFGGYTAIAIGSARMLGIHLMENFDAPYLSTSVAQFWRRWHISLTSWFKDYLYIPLGGSRKGKARKYLNKMIVFLVSGLWHGANLTYVIWGGINGVYQVFGEMTFPLRKKMTDFFHLHRESLGHKLFQGIITFVLIDLSWVFFRAENIHEAMEIVKSIFNADNPWIFADGSLYKCGLEMNNFILMLLGIGILLFADRCKRKNIRIREVIIRQDGWFRWVFIALAITAILTFGIWGPTYNAANFIYFQFGGVMRMKVAARIIGCLLTICLTIGLLASVTDLTERKASDSKYADFFQDRDYDVLFMGTSHVINGVFPMELWNEYGITSYNFGGHSNQIPTTYWVMENALDYVTPKVIVIDCLTLSSEHKCAEEFSFLHLSMDAFPLSLTKIRAIWDLLDDPRLL